MLVWSHHTGLDKSCQLRGGLWWVMTCNFKSPWLQRPYGRPLVICSSELESSYILCFSLKVCIQNISFRSRDKIARV